MPWRRFGVHSIFSGLFLLSGSLTASATPPEPLVIDVTRMNWSSELKIRIQLVGCVPSEASGWGHAAAGVAVVANDDAGGPNCTPETCSALDLASENSTDSSADLFGRSVWAGVACGSGSDCTHVAASAEGLAMVSPTSVESVARYGPATYGYWMFDRTYSVFRYWSQPPCILTRDGLGFAGPRAIGEAELDATFDPQEHCQPTVSIEVYLRRSFEYYHDEYHDRTKGSRDVGHDPLVRWCSIIVTNTCAEGGTATTVLQGVAAEIFTEPDLSSVRLGIFEAPGFAQDPLPDGQEVFGESTIDIGPPAADAIVVSISSVTDAFSEFDCDINADGAACPEDVTLMQGLAADIVLLGDLRYTARADFDLNGVINAADLQAFNVAYAALPDCNSNAIPDGCDILRGTSLDANEDGIPDECEKGDVNCDGLWNGLDVKPFALAIIDPVGYATAYPDCDIFRADMDGDGNYDFDDVPEFAARLLVGAP